MNVMEIENAARFAWPALEEKELPFGVLRYACGTDRRANSLNLFPNAELEAETLIDTTEKFFTARAAAPIVRIVQPDGNTLDAGNEIDAALSDRGYEKQATTLSMLLDLMSLPDVTSSLGAATSETPDVESWLRAWYGLTGRELEKMCVHKLLLERSSLSHRFLLKSGLDGIPMGSGMAVCADRAVGLFGISTAAEHRRQGHAREIIESLLRWGFVQGARFAYLQVEESNRPAVNLYESLGFKKAYSYWYRVGKQKTFNCGD